MFFEDIFGGGMPGMRGGPREPVDNESLYKELGVEKNATEREIKKAWRKLAKTHHPDRGGDPDIFKKKEAAYHVLSDSEKRSLYDQGGLEAVQQGGVAPSNIFDLFGNRGRQQRDMGPKKPSPIKETLVIKLEDVFQGGEKKINVTILCADSKDTCSRCSGRGSYMETVRRGPMILQSQRECQQCHGRGISYVNERKVKKSVEFFLPSGVKDGDKQTLHDEGHQLPGMPHGDVIVTYKVKKHQIFKRIQADLAMAREITLVDALCGFSFHVKSLEPNSWLKISSKPGQVIQPGDVVKVEGQGLPQRGARNSRGNLYVKFTVVLPKSGSLNANTKKQIKKILGGKSVKYEMPNQSQNDTREITTGSKVKLIGLTNRPDLNGTDGVVLEANIRPGAHAVQLETGQTVSVRQELLELTEEFENSKVAETPKPDDMIDEVTGEVVDLEKEKHTSSGVGHHAHDEDSDEEGGPVSCRQM